MRGCLETQGWTGFEWHQDSGENDIKFEGRNDRIGLLVFGKGTKVKERIQRKCLILPCNLDSIQANLTHHISIKSID